MRGDQPAGVPLYAIFPRFTPHARGSTYHDSWSMSRKIIYPACAGINPKGTKEDALAYNLPRMRGDQPASGTDRADMPAFTPHARGSTQFDMPPARRASIYPACAGITLRYSAPVTAQKDLPRMCGDQPAIENCCAFQRKFTPHTRGST